MDALDRSQPTGCDRSFRPNMLEHRSILQACPRHYYVLSRLTTYLSCYSLCIFALFEWCFGFAFKVSGSSIKPFLIAPAASWKWRRRLDSPTSRTDGRFGSLTTDRM